MGDRLHFPVSRLPSSVLRPPPNAMSQTVIQIEHLSKSYRLGQIGTGTFARDLAVWWSRLRGKPNPMLRIGQQERGNRVGEELWALKDVSFNVEQGEALGIIGRNGAGKSTLLKILSRVTAPTSGRIKVKGRIASLLEVGTGFHPELTGRENVYLNGAILGMRRDEIAGKFDEIVDFAGVEKFIDTPVKRYSSGMYVRLAFAVAAHLDPEILVVDEVLAVGDAEFQKKCLGKMGEVAQGGRTVLFVSHNMGALKALCPNSIWLEDGRLKKRTETSQAAKEYTALNNQVKKTSEWLHKAGTLEVVISDVFFLRNAEIDYGEEIDIHAKITAREDVKDISLFLLLKSSSGEYLASPFQSDTSKKFNVRAQASCNISVKFTPYLLPGTYAIDVGIFDKYYHFYDWIESALNLTVKENPALRNRLGYISPPAQWTVTPSDTHE
ncbi:MAG: hypothetical protein Fur002_05300 [Anaerolineales bacterium]